MIDMMIKKGQVLRCYRCNELALIALRDIHYREYIKEDQFETFTGTLKNGDIVKCNNCDTRIYDELRIIANWEGF